MKLSWSLAPFEVEVLRFRSFSSFTPMVKTANRVSSPLQQGGGCILPPASIEAKSPKTRSPSQNDQCESASSGNTSCWQTTTLQGSAVLEISPLSSPSSFYRCRRRTLLQWWSQSVHMKRSCLAKLSSKGEDNTIFFLI